LQLARAPAPSPVRPARATCAVRALHSHPPCTTHHHGVEPIGLTSWPSAPCHVAATAAALISLQQQWSNASHTPTVTQPRHERIRQSQAPVARCPTTLLSHLQSKAISQSNNPHALPRVAKLTAPGQASGDAIAGRAGAHRRQDACMRSNRACHQLRHGSAKGTGEPRSNSQQRRLVARHRAASSGAWASWCMGLMPCAPSSVPPQQRPAILSTQP
jgi:hypothetical protein